MYMPAKAWSTLVEGDLKIKRTSTNGLALLSIFILFHSIDVLVITQLCISTYYFSLGVVLA